MKPRQCERATCVMACYVSMRNKMLNNKPESIRIHSQIRRKLLGCGEPECIAWAFSQDF